MCEHRSVQQEQIRDPGQSVEIDESKFGISKYGRELNTWGQWVFGAVDLTSKKIILVSVEQKDAQTLIPIIQRYILTSG